MNELYAAASQPWSPASLPLMAEWLQAMDQPLAVIVESTKRPRRFDPLLSGSNPPLLLDASMPMVQSHRDAAKSLAARAMLHLQAGNIPEAWQDLLACHRLSRLTGQGRTIIEMLVATPSKTWPAVADQALVAHGNLTADQARQMLTISRSCRHCRRWRMQWTWASDTCSWTAQNLADHGLSQIGPMIEFAGDLSDGASEQSHERLVRIEQPDSPIRRRRSSWQCLGTIGSQPPCDNPRGCRKYPPWRNMRPTPHEFLGHHGSTLFATLVPRALRRSVGANWKGVAADDTAGCTRCRGG